MILNSKALAKTWPYRRYKEFETELRNSSSRWFKEKGLKTHSKMPYCLDSYKLAKKYYMPRSLGIHPGRKQKEP